MARELLANGEQGHKLNFPDDYTEVFIEVMTQRYKALLAEINPINFQNKESSSQHIGVSHDVKIGRWFAQRHSKLQKKMIRNGVYDNEETAAHASDTLARKLMANGEQGHKLNFLNEYTEVFREINNFETF